MEATFDTRPLTFDHNQILKPATSLGSLGYHPYDTLG